ncbi:PREDICTED: purine permease 3-like [Ipomoea nil]|uniref:purine permease 3-like n=1 Tax=Ipomoea nil TaxID=35883 RepID=UPI0009015B53|nr:PREDICTED: purine permease 3-like [Ipomoea nil]
MVESLFYKLKLKMEVSEGKGNMRGRLFLLLSAIMMCIGGCGGALLLRLYFIRGGNRLWFSTCLSTAGWPINFIPLAAAYYTRRRHTTTTAASIFTITRNTFLAAAALGVLLGIINYLYTYGVSKLPVSTSALIAASQLAFTAGGAFLLVKQRFTAFSVNAVVLLTFGAGVLAVGSNGDRPAGESKKEYVAAFLMTLASAALYGALLPCIELTYIKGRQSLTYTLVLEFQMVMSLFATAFCTVGMLVNKDFQAISREARGFEIGEANYYVVVVVTALIWQILFIGAAGSICYGSSLLSGIILAATISLTEVFAVVFYGEKFGSEKGISLTLSLWGIVSYFYGEMKNGDNNKKEELQIQVTNMEPNETLPM